MKRVYHLFSAFMLFTLCTQTHAYADETFFGKELKGYFSIGEGRAVKFSPGNLQYQASTNTWRFAEEQYDAISLKQNYQLSEDYDDWIDLLKFASSGYNSLYPYSDENYNTASDITNTNYDWGVYNPIINGGNKAGMWRTMTIDEWRYLFYGRANAKSLFAYATVNGQAGVILFPDNFESTLHIHFGKENYTLQVSTSLYDNNIIDTYYWQQLEEQGAVFLPQSGSIPDAPYDWFYWSSTVGDYCHDCDASAGAYAWFIHRFGDIRSTDPDWTGDRRSIRLVHDTIVQCKIDVVSNNEGMGFTVGSGTYNNGEWATIEAISYDNYKFVQWNDGNTDSWRQVLVQGDATYEAYFENAPIEKKYYIAGCQVSEENWSQMIDNDTWCCGYQWLANGCELERWDNNSYSKSFMLDAGLYEFKITAGDWGENYGSVTAYGDVRTDKGMKRSGEIEIGSNNCRFSLKEADSWVTISFYRDYEGADWHLYLYISYQGTPDLCDYDNYYIAGAALDTLTGNQYAVDEWCDGLFWEKEGCKLQPLAEHQWGKTFNLNAGIYEFKTQLSHFV